MPLDCKQHVSKIPQHVRTNCFALQAACKTEHEVLVYRHGEVIRPEICESFDEWAIGGNTLVESRGRFGNINGAVNLANLHSGGDGVRFVIGISFSGRALGSA